MRVAIPETINIEHLMSNDEMMRIIQSVPSSKDRIRLLSHSVVAAALAKLMVDGLVEPADPPSVPSMPLVAVAGRWDVEVDGEGELPWAVINADGVFLSGHTSRSKARAACDRGAGQRVKNIRNPNGKG